MGSNHIEGSSESPAEEEAAADEDATDALGRLLGVDRNSILDSLGGQWRALRPAHATDSPVDALATDAWFIAGEPVQVLIGVSAGLGHVLVSPGRAVRYDNSLIGAVLSSARSLPLEGERWLNRLGKAVQDAATRSRRSFFWCSICRTCNAPDDRYEAKVCRGCAERYLGVVS